MFRLVQREVKRTRPIELVREYIADSLYNPNYGYFNKNVKIMPTNDGIDFNRITNQAEFQRCVQRIYGYDRYIRYEESDKFFNKWHTPSELFYPHYGYAIAKRILTILGENSEILDRNEGKLCLIEVGPGNGAMSQSIFDFFHLNAPHLASSIQYHLIDISSQFSEICKNRLRKKYTSQCHFHNWSFLDQSKIRDVFSGHQNQHWFILGFELLDNLCHDKILYDNDGTLMQCTIESNDSAKFGDVGYRERYIEAEDSLILDLMYVLDRIGYRSPSLKWHLSNTWYDVAMGTWINPQRTEYIPTEMFQLLRNVIYNFPQHTLLLGDFFYLLERTEGYNGPLVQTTLRGETIPVKNYLVKRGIFDILFETNFDLLQRIYNELTSMLRGTAPTSRVYDHAEFMARNADLAKTTLKNGYSPLLYELSNVKYFEGTVKQPTN